MRNKESEKFYVVYHGELSTQKKILRRGAGLLSPGLIWVSIFLFIPLLALIVISFAERGNYGGIEWTFSLTNIKRLLGYSFFGWSPDNLIILGRSLQVAIITTILCVVISYPLAFFIASRPEKNRILWLSLILIPFWTNLVIRAYAWILVLGPNMPFARFAQSLGIISRGMALYPTSFAVYIGMISTFLPFVTLPLYSAVEKLDLSLLEAVSDLYGGKLRIFIHGILPQTVAGMTVGVTLTLIPAMGMFVVPDILGGAKYMLIGNLIKQQVTTSMDLPFGAMISFALMILTIITLLMTHTRSMDKKEKR